jgi:hypothetical protein
MYQILKRPPYQNWWWRRRGIDGDGDGAFDPITVDPDNNLLAFDADFGLTTDGWEDQVGSNDMEFPLGATLVTVNGLPAVQHSSGGTQYGQVVTPAMPVEPDGLTYYFVHRSSYTGNRFVTSDGRGTNYILGMRHQGGSPSKSWSIGAQALNKPTNFPDNYTWHVSIIQLKSGAGQQGTGWRINKGTKVLSSGLVTGKIQHGMVISADKDGSIFSHSTCQWAYILVRNGIDTEEQQDAYIDHWNTKYNLGIS